MVAFDPTDMHFGLPATLSDVTGRRILVNDRYAELLRMPKDEILNAPWQTMTHPDDMKSLSLPFSHLIASGEPYLLRCRMRRGDGGWIPLVFHASRSIESNTGRILVRGQVRPDNSVETPDPVRDTQPSDDFMVADHIREITHELVQLAGAKRMHFLQHLLAMANMEAATEMSRNLKTAEKVVQMLNSGKLH